MALAHVPAPACGLGCHRMLRDLCDFPVVRRWPVRESASASMRERARRLRQHMRQQHAAGTLDVETEGDLNHTRHG
eukprot:365963-Chlamydomonas_euryale.AAC.5